MDPRVVGIRDPGLRVERQAQAQRRIAGDQVAPLGPQEPRPALPADFRRTAALHRQHVADHLVESLREHLAEARAFQGVVELGVERVDIGGKLAFLPEVVPDVLERREDVARIEGQPRGQRREECLRRPFVRTVVDRLVGKQLRILPNGLLVLPPEKRQRPARQLLARVPLALAVMQQALGGVTRLEFGQQARAEPALHGLSRRGIGVGIPLRPVAIVGRNESRLAPHREPHVLCGKVRVNPVAKRFDLRPLLFRIRLRYPRRFPHPHDLHRVRELGLALVGQTGDRRGAARLRRAGQRDMALARKQARSRVEADPTGARQVDLAPRVQVGEIHFRAGRAIERFHIGFELDQVAGNEPRGEAKVPQQLHEQPAGVSARAARVGERRLRRLHAGLHANEVLDVVLQPLNQRNQEVDRRRRLPGNLREVLREQWCVLKLHHVRRQLVQEHRVFVGEREFFGERL